MCITVNKWMMENEDLNGYELAVYTALRAIIPTTNQEQLITLNNIFYKLTGKTKFATSDKRTKGLLIEALKGLQDNEIIEILETNQNEYLIRWASDYGDYLTKTFLKLEDEQVRFLFNDGKDKIFKYLFDFAYYMVSNEHYYYLGSRKDMADYFEMSLNTLDKYNKALEECGIMYIHRSNHRFKDTGKTLENMYCFNDEAVIKIVQDHSKNFIKEHETIRIGEKNKEELKGSGFYSGFPF